MNKGTFVDEPGRSRLPVGSILTLTVAMALASGTVLLLDSPDRESAPSRAPEVHTAAPVSFGSLHAYRTPLGDPMSLNTRTGTPDPDPVLDPPALVELPADDRLLGRLAGQAALESAEALLRGLRRLSLDGGSGITPRQADWVRRALDALAQEGAAAIPAIYRVLSTFEDVPFGDGGAAIGAESLRLGLIETLGWIGGPEAEAVLAEQLGMTAEPAEVAAVADILDALAPGLYGEAVLEAVQETLTLVSRGPAGMSSEAADPASFGKTDAAPLFELLQTYPQEQVATELERLSATFGQYAPVSLGKLPDGQGVPALERMVGRSGALEEPEGQLAMRMLAQMAPEEPAAQAVLLERVRAGDIPESFWPMLADVVAGDHQLQIAHPEHDGTEIGSRLKQNTYSTYTVSGRHVQRLYSVHRSATLSSSEFHRRMDLIDRLYRETADPAALQALQKAEALLMGRNR
jgi:hypothetical protein